MHGTTLYGIIILLFVDFQHNQALTFSHNHEMKASEYQSQSKEINKLKWTKTNCILPSQIFNQTHFSAK